MMIKTHQARFEAAPSEESVILFLVHHGWAKMANVPKYIKHGQIVNLKFMQDLINGVAGVEQTDTHTLLASINAFGETKAG